MQKQSSERETAHKLLRTTNKDILHSNVNSCFVNSNLQDR